MRGFLGLVLFQVAFLPCELPAQTSSTAAYSIGTVAGSDWNGDGDAGTAAILLQAQGIASDPNGNLYISDAADHRVRMLSPQGVISTIAGTGQPGFSGDGGPATAAQLNSPYGLVYNRGALYIADLGNARVRRVFLNGTGVTGTGPTITTVAGGGTLTPGGANEGTAATMIALAGPRNLAVDPIGNLYISDFLGQRVFRMNTSGALTTVAGTGVRGNSGDFSPAFLAQVNYPTAIAVDGQGSLYIADSQNHQIRKVANGVISSFATTTTPTGLAFDGAGTLYAVDPSAGLLFAIPAIGRASSWNIAANDVTLGADGSLYVVAGSIAERVGLFPQGSSQLATVAGGGDLGHGDQGEAILARLNHPSGVAVDALGNIYIADRDNHRIRKITTDGTISTIVGTGAQGNTGDGGLATKALLNAPSAVSVDATGNVYIADTGNHRVRKVTASGLIQAVAGTGVAGSTGDQAPAFLATLSAPGGIVTDAAGNIYIADTGSGNIRFVSGSTVLIATLVSGLKGPRGLARDGAGNLYFTEQDGARVRKLSPLGILTDLAPGVWNIPRGIAVDSAGNIFIADTGLQEILRVDPNGIATVVAGNGIAGLAGDGGPATAAELGFPWDVATAKDGTVLIADLNNNQVRELTPGPAPETDPGSEPQALNAASMLTGPIAPGMQVLLQNTGLKASDSGNAQVIFASTVSGSVPFNVPGAILYLGDTQVLVQAPSQIASLGNLQIEILKNGVLIASVTAIVAGSAPGLYTSAPGQAAALNQDGTVNSPANPASRGSVISLWGTGQGIANLPVAVSIGGYDAKVTYAGSVAGYPGLYQVNVQIPSGFVPTGDLGLVLTVGQASSQAGLSIAVN